METKRLVNVGAEGLMHLVTPVLDKGYIKLVDYLGTDETVVAAARHSYDKGLDQDDTAGNERLINYLMRERHTSPFEQPALVFEVKSPIFVFREWHRHRTAKLNEMSGRYVELPDEFYVPDVTRVKGQSKSNKQASGDALPESMQEFFQEGTIDQCDDAFGFYKASLAGGVARELARIVLPVSTYSKMVWQCDLHNLLHFLKLRMGAGAQWEIKQYAIAIAAVVQEAFPKTWEAFDEYVLNAVTLSKTERKKLIAYLNGEGVDDALKVIEKLY